MGTRCLKKRRLPAERQREDITGQIGSYPRRKAADVRRVASWIRTGKEVNDMGKGRWWLSAANCNHAGPRGQRPEPAQMHELSETCAVKSRTHGSSGGKGPRGPYLSQFTGASKELLEQEVKPLVEEFLKERGLQLSPEKTVITHIEQGFDFLGQTVRKDQKGKEAKCFITPSKKNVKACLAKIRKHIK